MRPGQNKRMRGRNNNNNNRKGPNPLTRSYESNGPDVKIRGTAHHIGEKYLQLARDAQSSDDPVKAESYLQHAEHYFRLIAAAQQAQQQAQFGYQRQPGDPVEQDDEDGDDDFASLPDRFASPLERVVPAPAPQQQPYGGQPYSDRQPQMDRQPQGDRQHQGGGERFDRNGAQPYQYGERQAGDRQNDRQDRGYDNRNNRGSYQERNGGDRNGPDRGGQDRGGQDRGGQDRGGQGGYDRNAAFRGDGGQDRSNDRSNDRNGADRPPRDYDNRGFRGPRNRDDRRDDRQPREYREPNPPREARQPVPDEQPGSGLPAFITGPVRSAPEAVASEQPPSLEAPATTPETTDDAGFHMRPRRRRRPKPDFAGAEAEGGNHDAPAGDPVGE